MEREADLELEKQKAEAAARAESEFLAEMSHEIRTPMTAILDLTETLAARGLPDGRAAEQREAIDTIRRCGDHLLQVVDRILDRARLEAGRVEIEPVPFSPIAAVEEILALMRPHAEAKGLKLELEIDSSTPAAVESDPMRIRQILINLVGNAIKFTDSGGVCITLGQPVDAQGTALQLEVIDSGIGMSPAQIDAIFEPYAQGDQRLGSGREGAGLGLSICRGLTLLLGGTIEVESEPGRGSTFRVQLPCRAVDASRIIAGSGRLALPGGCGQPSVLDRVRPRLHGPILIAEDNAESQRVIAGTLREAGAEVKVASDGESALKMVREWQQRGNPFHAVLMGYGDAGDGRPRSHPGPASVGIRRTDHRRDGARLCERPRAVSPSGLHRRPRQADRPE